MTILIRSHGINWDWFYKLQIEGNTAKVLESWRAHKFEDRGYYPKESEITAGNLYANQCDIDAWRDDGKPGGIDGLRANYRKADMVLLDDGTTYTIVN